MTIVRRWTGLEANLLREALRLSVRDFAAHLGVGERTVNKWEARLAGITLRPHMQEVLDTALARASDEARARFAAVVHAGTPAPEESSPPTTAPLQGGMLPVVLVDGRVVLVPFDVGALAATGLGTVLNELKCVATALPNARRSADYSVVGDVSEDPALLDDIYSDVLCCGRKELSEADEAMIRREVLRLTSVAGALLMTQSGEPHLDWERLEYLSSRTCLDPGTIDDLALLNDHLWFIFATAKHKRITLPFVRKQLRRLTDALRSSHGEDAHKRLCALAGDLFQLAGEVFFDSNQYTHAAHCYTLAVAASKEANAFDLWACAMTRHAFIGVYERQFDQSSHMLEFAAGLARRGDSFLATKQWVQVVRAQSLAGLGKLDECQRALDEAEQVNLLTGRVHTGGWLRFDGSRLAEERGACYVELKRPDLAEVVLTQALSQDLSPRRRGSVLIDLATMGLQCRDSEQLVRYVDAALDTVRQTGSGVISRKLHGLQARLAPFTSDRHVRHLDEKITAVTRTFAS